MNLKSRLNLILLGAFLVTSTLSSWAPAALAQNNTYQSLCQTPRGLISLNATFGSTTGGLPSVPGLQRPPMQVRYDATFRPTGTAAFLTAQPASPTAVLYRAATSSGQYGVAETKPLPLTLRLPNWEGNGEFTNDPPEGAYRYFVLVRAVVDGRTVSTCSSESLSYVQGSPRPNEPTDESNDAELRNNFKQIDLVTAEKWFGGSVGQYQNLVVRDQGDEPPLLVLPANRTLGRPEITFDLDGFATYVDNVVNKAQWGKRLGWVAEVTGVASAVDRTIRGMSGVGQVIWMQESLKGYFTDTANNTVFTWVSKTHNLIASTDTDANLEFFWLNLESGNPVHLRGSLAPNWFNAAAGRFEHAAASPYFGTLVNKVFRENIRDCQNAAPTVYPERLTGDKAYHINNKPDPKCLYDGVDGWLAKWGIQPKKVGEDGACDINIFTEFKGGLGELFFKMIDCVVSWFYDSVIETVEGWFTSVGGLSYMAPLEYDWASKFAGLFGIEKAYAGYEDELKDPNSAVVSIWKVARSLVNIFVILALLAIAFANILHLNINTYAAKKALPGIVLGVIGANASLLIMRFLADVAQAVASLAVALVPGATQISGLFTGMQLAINKSLLLLIGAGAGTWGITVIIVTIGLLYYLFLLLAFLFALVKRLVILYMLSMVAPLAFAAYGLPQTQPYFFKWWNAYLTYLFLFAVILLGMAMTILIAQNLSVGWSPVVTVRAVIGPIVILGAATMTLKLPKIMTKGVIDLASTFKKTLALAPAAVQVAQGAHKWHSNNRKLDIQARYERQSRRILTLPLGSPERQAARLEAAAVGRERTAHAARTETTAKRLKTGLGWATAFGRPEHFADAYKARAERAQKNSYIAAMTKTSGLYGYVRGAEAEAELAKKLGLDESKDARTIGDLEDLSKTLFKGHIEAVENKLRIKEAMERAANGDKKEFEKLRQKAANLKNSDEVDEFVEMLATRTGMNLRIGSIKDYHDMMKWSAFQFAITRVSRGIRDTEEGVDPYEKGAIKVARAFPGYSLHNRAAPFAGAGEGGGSASQPSDNPFVDLDESINERVKQIVDHSAHVRLNPTDAGRNLEMQQRLNGLMNGWSAALTENLDGLDEAGIEKIKVLRQDTADLLSSSLGEDAIDIRAKISEALSGNIDEQGRQSLEQLKQITENHSAAIASGAGAGRTINQQSVHHLVSGAYQGNQVVGDAQQQVMAQFDEQKLANAVAQAMGGSMDDLHRMLDSTFSPHLSKLAQIYGREASGEQTGKAIQKLETSLINAVSGKDQRSLKSVLSKQIESLPEEMGMYTLGSHSSPTQPSSQETPTN
jgi:hypothetical protein